MPEFVVGAQLEVAGELWLMVETTSEVVGCEGCGMRAMGHGRRWLKVRDLPMADRPVVLVWAKRLWRCPDPDCAVGTWSEEVDDIAPRAALTERARAEICCLVGEAGHSVAQVARDFGVGWHTAMAAVRDHGRPRVDHLSRLGAPRALGVDEHSFLAATAEHPTLLVTGFVDLDRHRLLDVVPGRTAQGVSGWLAARLAPWRATIRAVALDPYAGYARGLADGLPHAELVVDHFHAVRLANAALDEVRRRVQQETLGHRGRKGDPLYRIRRQLLVAHERLSERGWARIQTGLNVGDPAGEVGAAYLAKELLREVYDTTSQPWARRPLERFYAHCRAAEVVELRRLATTGRRWEPEILGWHRTGLSKRANRGHEPADQEDQTGRPRLPQLRELSPPASAPLRRRMTHSTRRTNQRPPTTLSRVDPHRPMPPERSGLITRQANQVLHSRGRTPSISPRRWRHWSYDAKCAESAAVIGSPVHTSM
jgi:transposase